MDWLIDLLLERWGFIAAVPVLAALGWWNWETLKSRPGVGRMLRLPTLPKAIPDRFNVALANLVGDEDGRMKQIVLEGLKELKGFSTLSFDRTISASDGDVSHGEEKAHALARSLLRISGADLLIWGVVLKTDQHTVPKLYYTPLDDGSPDAAMGNYLTNETLQLPLVFGQDLANLLAVLITSRTLDVMSFDATFEEEAVEQLVSRGRALLNSSTAEKWTRDTRLQISALVSGALSVLGRHTLSERSIREAVESYRDLLRELEDGQNQRMRDLFRVYLADALVLLGEIELNGKPIEEAIGLFRAVAADVVAYGDTGMVATVDYKLATGLALLGAIENRDGPLLEAEKLQRDLLTTFTQVSDPSMWAFLGTNLATTLRELGRVRSDSRRVEAAILMYLDILEHFGPRDSPGRTSAAKNLEKARLLLESLRTFPREAAPDG